MSEEEVEYRPTYEVQITLPKPLLVWLLYFARRTDDGSREYRSVIEQAEKLIYPYGE